MRTYGRLLALGALCAGALGLTAVPASAVTISLGGQHPTVPVTLPLGLSVSAGVGNNGVQADVQAPSTDVSLNADPSGVRAKATVAGHPVAAVGVTAPAIPALPAPVATPAPEASSPPVAPAPANAPSSSPSTGAPIANDHPSAHVGNAPRAVDAGGLATRDLRDATPAGDRTPTVNAEIASSPGSGFLHALPGGDARVVLWLALAGAVLALRYFVGGSTSKATRAS
jgi:hypothetical protein